MKKLCSGLMAIVLSLCQVCSTCSAEGNAEYNESYSRYLSKSSKKDKEDCKGTDATNGFTLFGIPERHLSPVPFFSHPGIDTLCPFHDKGLYKRKIIVISDHDIRYRHRFLHCRSNIILTTGPDPGYIYFTVFHLNSF